MAPNLKARCNVAHKNRKQTAQRRTDTGNNQRVFDGLHAMREYVLIVIKGDRVVDTPDFHERPNKDHGVNGNDKSDNNRNDTAHDAG